MSEYKYTSLPPSSPMLTNSNSTSPPVGKHSAYISSFKPQNKPVRWVPLLFQVPERLSNLPKITFLVRSRREILCMDS